LLLGLEDVDQTHFFIRPAALARLGRYTSLYPAAATKSKPRSAPFPFVLIPRPFNLWRYLCGLAGFGSSHPTGAYGRSADSLPGL